MSILIAYKHKDTIYMGTDTRFVNQDYKRTLTQQSMYKIQKMDNGMLVGVVCNGKERQVIMCNPGIFTLDKNSKLTRRHILHQIIPRLLLICHAEGLLDKEEKFPFCKATIVLAYKDVMYTILSNFAVVKNEKFAVCGDAWSLANATIANTKPTDDINQRIVKALCIASKYSQNVGAPYLLIDTKTQNYTIVEEDD